MGLSVKERGEAVATFRFVQVNLMETLARWVPTTPEMEVKLLLGEHIWDAAQHADALGRRTYELRLPLQHSLRPAEDYVRVLDELAGALGTAERIGGFYGVVLPRLGGRYRSYLERTDRLLDGPTVRIVERILDDQARMLRQSEKLAVERPDLGPADGTWLDRLAKMESAVREIVASRPEEPVAREG